MIPPNKAYESESAGLRRRWKLILVLGIALAMGPALGQVGTVVGMIYNYSTIEKTRAPTPNDLAVGIQIGILSTTIGLLAGAVGVPLVLLGCLKLAGPRDAPRAEIRSP